MAKSLQKSLNCIAKAGYASNPEGLRFLLTGEAVTSVFIPPLPSREIRKIGPCSFAGAVARMGILRPLNSAPPSADCNSGHFRPFHFCSNSKRNFGRLSAGSRDSRILKKPSVYAMKRKVKILKSSEPVDSGIKRRQDIPKQIDGIGDEDGPSFDICSVKTYVKSMSSIQLEIPSHLKNKEKMHDTGGHDINMLRPGMLLLRRYISVADQVKIVEVCRKLGLGSGGFYQPRHLKGGKLKLKMMSLGKSWDPQRFGYGDLRPTDGARPPSIPDEFHMLVEHAMRESHTYLRELYNGNVEDILPFMNPDICIVNFYAESGHLGLHQDKEESKESLSRRLPVVSISIGDSAEFVYGDDRKNVEKVVLE